MKADLCILKQPKIFVLFFYEKQNTSISLYEYIPNPSSLQTWLRDWWQTKFKKIKSWWHISMSSGLGSGILISNLSGGEKIYMISLLFRIRIYIVSWSKLAFYWFYSLNLLVNWYYHLLQWIFGVKYTLIYF